MFLLVGLGGVGGGVQKKRPLWWSELQCPDLCPAVPGLSPTTPQPPEKVQQYLFDLSIYTYPK